MVRNEPLKSAEHLRPISAPSVSPSGPTQQVHFPAIFDHVVAKGVQGTVLHPCKKIGVVAGFAELHDQVEHGCPPRGLGARDN